MDNVTIITKPSISCQIIFLLFRYWKCWQYRLQNDISFVIFA